MKAQEELLEPKWAKKMPYKVPENYFEEFPTRIQKRITEEKKQPKHLEFWPIVKPYLSLAAMMIFVAGGVYFGTRGFLTGQKVEILSENTLLADAVYFDETTLATEYQDNVMNKTIEKANENEKILINEDISISDLEQTLN